MLETKVTFTLNQLVGELNRQADGILRERFNLTFSQFTFLVTLLNGRSSITEVAKSLDVSVAAVSKKVDWFVQRGLTRTQGDPSNARKVLVELTAKGKKSAMAAGDELERRFIEIFTCLPALDLRKLNRDLLTVLENLNAKTKEIR